ncbi:MAG: uracil-DNA glycosylase family protein [Gemmatimonadaceae bacterium]
MSKNSEATTLTLEEPRAGRIIGHAIAPLAPVAGSVSVLIVGEAPGPRGADKSGFPFFGDAAGKHLYLALRKLGAVQLPDGIDELPWDGAKFRAAGYAPIAINVALTNAFNHCPTDDGMRFRAPTRAELEGDENSSRLATEISGFKKRGLGGVVTLGKVAERTVRFVIDKHFANEIQVHALPHPSAQGLLSMAPNRGRGAKMADLQAQWMQQCMNAIHEAGFGFGTLPSSNSRAAT